MYNIDCVLIQLIFFFMNEYRVKDNTVVLVWRSHSPAKGVDDAVEQGVLDLYVFRLQALEQQGVQQRGAGEQTGKRGRTERS